MAHLLQIDASPRGNRSTSRMLGQEFIDKWMAAYPNDTVTYRDLGHHPFPTSPKHGLLLHSPHPMSIRLS